MFVGLDVAKGEHHAKVLHADTQIVAARTVRNEPAAALQAVRDETVAHGAPAVVVDQPGSVAALTVAGCQQREVAVA